MPQTAENNRLPASPVGLGPTVGFIRRRFPLVPDLNMGTSANRGLVSLLDQAVYSGTNFLTTVLIGRFAGQSELGIYALAFSILVLFLCTQETLVALPYLIRFRKHQVPRQQRFAGSVLVHGMGIWLLSACFLGIAALVCHLMVSPSFTATFSVLAVVVPWLLLREFVRKFLMAHLQMLHVLVLDGAVSAIQLGGLLTLAYFGWLSAATAFAIGGCSCGLVGLLWITRSYQRFPIHRQDLRDDLSANWEFGRWIFASLLTLMLHSMTLLWLITLDLGTQAAGIFTACSTIVFLANPFVMAIHNVMLPRMAQARQQGGIQQVRRISLRVARIVAVFVGTFGIAIALVGNEIVTLAFGEQYAGYPWLLILLALGVWARSLEMIPQNGLLIIEKPQHNLWINAGGLALLLALAPPLIMQWGLMGAAVAAAVTSMATMVVRWILFFTLLGQASDAETPVSAENSSVVPS